MQQNSLHSLALVKVEPRTHWNQHNWIHFESAVRLKKVGIFPVRKEQVNNCELTTIKTVNQAAVWAIFIFFLSTAPTKALHYYGCCSDQSEVCMYSMCVDNWMWGRKHCRAADTASTRTDGQTVHAMFSTAWIQTQTLRLQMLDSFYVCACARVLPETGHWRWQCGWRVLWPPPFVRRGMLCGGLCFLSVSQWKQANSFFEIKM